MDCSTAETCKKKWTWHRCCTSKITLSPQIENKQSGFWRQTLGYWISSAHKRTGQETLVLPMKKNRPFDDVRIEQLHIRALPGIIWDMFEQIDIWYLITCWAFTPKQQEICTLNKLTATLFGRSELLVGRDPSLGADTDTHASSCLPLRSYKLAGN